MFRVDTCSVLHTDTSFLTPSIITIITTINTITIIIIIIIIICIIIHMMIIRIND